MGGTWRARRWRWRGKKAWGQCYHLSTKTHISIRDLVEKICGRLGKSIKEVAEITEDRPGKDAAYLLDSAKAKAELGWEPEISLDQGIEETISWIESNLEELKQQPARLPTQAMIQPRRILVTGGCGYVGSMLLPPLAEARTYRAGDRLDALLGCGSEGR